MKQSISKSEANTLAVDKLSAEAKLFYQFHGIQMIGSELPTTLIESLYQKLKNEIYDGGNYFQILDNQDDQTYQIRATQDINARQHIFIIDHALTFRYPDLTNILKQNQQIIGRLDSMLKYHQEPKKLETSLKIQNQTENQQILEIQFDNMQLKDISALQFPPKIITLSLIGNELEDEDEIIKKLEYLNLKVLWLNENPVVQKQKLKQYIKNKTKIQLYNRQFTENCRDWGIKYAHTRNINFANNTNNFEVYSLNLDGRNIFNVKIQVLKQFSNLKSLSIRNHSIEEQKNKEFILLIIKQLSNLRYLYVDDQVQNFLIQSYKNGLIDKNIVSSILINKHSIESGQLITENDSTIERITRNIFKIAGCYRLANTQKLDESSCWYVNDELGSLIPHSDEPNIKMIPFLYAANNKMDENLIAYSLIWPLKDIKKDQIITRDYLHGMTEQRQRSSRLAIWYQLPQPYYLNLINKYNQKMFNLSTESVLLLQKFYNQNGIKQKQYLSKQLSQGYFEDKHRVICDYQYINTYLKHQRFEIVTDIEKATIVWMVTAAEQEEWKKYKGKFYFNQFPFESCIVLKHNLADTVQSVLGDTKFLMRTYNLEKELHLMIGDFYKRQKEGLDNLWILKPPNMARSMDMIITDNLSVIIKSMETGPKIAQKYICKPVLRRGRKVDLRFILLVKSINPLILYLYKNFWIRSSNNPYTVDRRHLSTYQTQFTVMNYGKVSSFQQIPFKQFIQQFEKDYKTRWSTINQKIKKMLRNVMIAVHTKYPEMHDQKSRAVYGIDIMIDEETMEPKLLEITFSPDCKRACEYYPTFYDEIFQTLFLEGPGENMERII